MKIGDVLIVHKDVSSYDLRRKEEFCLGIVSRVGRKYVYVNIVHNFHKEVRFHIETKLSMDTYFGNGYKYYTNLRDLQLVLLHDKRRSALRNYGVSFAYNLRLDDDVLRRVCEALNLESAVYSEIEQIIDNLEAKMLELNNSNKEL